MKNNSAKISVIALAFLTCFLVVSILSGAFILAHANHEHDHNGANGSCAACAQLQNAENILKQFSTALAGALFIISGLYAAIGACKAIPVYVFLPTPVTQKIRINN